MPLEARRYVHLRHLLARCSAELVAGVLRAQPKTKKARISASLQIVVPAPGVEQEASKHHGYWCRAGFLAWRIPKRILIAQCTVVLRLIGYPT